MKQLMTHLRTFYELYFGRCDITINSRNHLTARIYCFPFPSRAVNLFSHTDTLTHNPTICFFTSPCIHTRIFYVQTTNTEPPVPDLHIPIRPVAPSS